MHVQKTFAAGGMALMLAISATAARAQVTPSSGFGPTFSATPNADGMTAGALGSGSGEFSNDFPMTTFP